MTAAAILILHTMCSDNDAFVGAQSGKEGSTWKPEYSPLTCDFVILPEFPVLVDGKEEEETEGFAHNIEDDPPYLLLTTDEANSDSYHDLHLWQSALSYQPAQYERKSSHDLNPCGWDNMVILRDVPPFSGNHPSYLLTITSCYVDFDVGNEQTPIPLFVQTLPSNFVFALEELVHVEEVFSSSSSSSSPLELNGFAEINVTFDYTISHLILEERLATISRQQQQQLPVNCTKETVDENFPQIQSSPDYSKSDSLFLSGRTCENEEFSLSFIQRLAEKEASDFRMILFIQAAIGVFIIVIFLWMGGKVFKTQPRPLNRTPRSQHSVDRRPSKIEPSVSSSTVPNVAAPAVEDAHCVFQDGMEKSNDATDECFVGRDTCEEVQTAACDGKQHFTVVTPPRIDEGKLSSIELTSLVQYNGEVQQAACEIKHVAAVTPPRRISGGENDPGDKVQQPACDTKHVPAVVTPPRSSGGEKKHFLLKYGQLDDSIPEDNDDTPAGCGAKRTDNDVCYDTNRDASKTSYFSPTRAAVRSIVSPCSAWTSQWLQNRTRRQRLRRLKREVKEHEGQPVFITPVSDVVITTNSFAEYSSFTELVSSAEASNIDSCQQEDNDGQNLGLESCTLSLESRFAFDEPSPVLTGDSFIRDYWGL